MRMTVRWAAAGIALSWVAMGGCSKQEPVAEVSLKGLPHYEQEIVKYLNAKPYTADRIEYKAEDIKVDDKVDAALEMAGLSVYTLLRNEPYARHGYPFKDDKLSRIYSHAVWYKENRDFQFHQLSAKEARNVEFIKSIETTYDYEKVARELESFGTGEVYEFYSDDGADYFSHGARLSLNHLRLNESRVLRNAIFARHGYKAMDPALNEIFTRVSWYKRKYDDLRDVVGKMSQEELADAELLRKREWLEILNSVNITLPRDVMAVPTVGYNAIFVRRVGRESEDYFYSSQFVHAVGAFDPSAIGTHRTDADKLVSEEVIRKIRAEKDPLKQLVLFFDNKKYEGYVDTVVFNHSDMTAPTYLQEAIEAYGVDYLTLLRKEIHARAGARFIDKKSGAVFSRCSWYRPRYDMTPRTPSRLPAQAKLTQQELTNFALLEGEELAANAKKYRGKNMVVDLSGKIYFVKTGEIRLGTDQFAVAMGSEFESLEEHEKADLQNIVDEIVTKYAVDIDSLLEQQRSYANIGC